jgi:hypothetical protein
LAYAKESIMTDEIKNETEIRDAEEKEALKRKQRAGQSQQEGAPGLGGRGGDEGARGGQRS